MSQCVLGDGAVGGGGCIVGLETVLGSENTGHCMACSLAQG